MENKIALEEHFAIPEAVSTLLPVVKRKAVFETTVERLLEVGEQRIAGMDQTGVAHSVLSLAAPGVQGQTDPDRARDLSVRFNDALAKMVSTYPARFSGFATVPLQDPEGGVTELNRAILDLGFKGVLVNGYTAVSGPGEGSYYDHERYLGFWKRLEELQVPLYMHPTFPLPSQRKVFEGYPYLLAAPWGFAVETASHAVRLMVSGLFDKFPGLRIILGHMGEFLPFAVARMAQRMRYIDSGLKKTVVDYFNENFYITTSGNFHTPSLIGALLQVGSDRILYATDYPYEEMTEAAEWFDHAPISEADRVKIGRTNAQQLLKL